MAGGGAESGKDVNTEGRLNSGEEMGPSFPKTRANRLRDRATLKWRGKKLTELMPTELDFFFFNKAV